MNIEFMLETKRSGRGGGGGFHDVSLLAKTTDYNGVTTSSDTLFDPMKRFNFFRQPSHIWAWTTFKFNTSISN